VGISRLRSRPRENRHGSRHPKGAEEHELSAAELFDGEDRDPTCCEVLGAVGGGEKAGESWVEADGLFIDCGGVVGDSFREC
jgi:hypothetical protein